MAFARTRWRLLLAIAGALALLAAFAFRPSPVLGVDGEALQHSVGGFFGPDRSCVEIGDQTWECSHYDAQMSGAVAYRVKVSGLGCWQARRTGFGGEGGSPRQLSGCLSITDFILG